MSKERKDLTQYIIKKQLDRLIKKEERKNQVLKEEVRIQKERQKRAAKVYADWLNEHKAGSRAAATIIWDWYKSFIISKTFEDINAVLKKLHYNSFKISDIIPCQVPNRYSGTWSERQALEISSGKELFVHNYVKYGKSYNITNREGLLREVFGPILIKIAGTIRDDSIWEVIATNLNPDEEYKF